MSCCAMFLALVLIGYGCKYRVVVRISALSPVLHEKEHFQWTTLYVYSLDICNSKSTNCITFTLKLHFDLFQNSKFPTSRELDLPIPGNREKLFPGNSREARSNSNLNLLYRVRTINRYTCSTADYSELVNFLGLLNKKNNFRYRNNADFL